MQVLQSLSLQSVTDRQTVAAIFTPSVLRLVNINSKFSSRNSGMQVCFVWSGLILFFGVGRGGE